MDLTKAERERIRDARVARLATADAGGRPNAVPICFSLVGGAVVTPIDEKPKTDDPTRLRRVRDIAENPFVVVLIDRYTEEWQDLWWVQLRGRAEALDPDDPNHETAIDALEAKYDQYETHRLHARPVIRIVVGDVISWGFDHTTS